MALASQDALEEGIRARWHGSYGMVDDAVCAVRPSSHADRCEVRDERTMCRLDKGWQRVDLRRVQCSSTEAEVRSALDHAGFAELRAYDAERDLGVGHQTGRTFFLAHNSAGHRQAAVCALPQVEKKGHIR